MRRACGSSPMMRAAVASTAGRLAPTSTSPIGFRLPRIGPSPSMQSMRVDDGQRARQRAVDVDDRLRNAVVVQHVLGPAVFDAGQHAVEVLHARRDADPVVRLELGQRDDEVGLDHAARQIDAGERAEAAAVVAARRRLRS